MKTVEYYKKAIRQAQSARESMERTKADYEHSCVLAKNALDAGILGEQGYKQQLAELEHDRDCRIEGALCRIDEVGAEYAAEMAELGRLDGGRIDGGVMKLLDSGLRLTNEDWQELANTYKDNYVMTRILKERYNANRPKSEDNGVTLGQKNSGLTFVQFGSCRRTGQRISAGSQSYCIITLSVILCRTRDGWLMHRKAITGIIVQKTALAATTRNSDG